MIDRKTLLFELSYYESKIAMYRTVISHYETEIAVVRMDLSLEAEQGTSRPDESYRQHGAPQSLLVPEELINSDEG
jgi:hypothetical protein